MSDSSTETDKKDNGTLIAQEEPIVEINDLKKQIAQSFAENNDLKIQMEQLSENARLGAELQKTEIANLKIQIRQLGENARLATELQKIETNNFVENDKAATALRKIQTDLLKSEVDKLVELVNSQTREIENLKKEVVTKLPTAQKTESGNNAEKLDNTRCDDTRSEQSRREDTRFEQSRREDTRSEQSRREDTESISSKFSTSSSKKKQFNLHYRFANAKNTEEDPADRFRERSQKRRGFREVVIKEPEPEPTSVPDKNQYDAKRKIAAASYLPSKRIHTRG